MKRSSYLWLTSLIIILDQASKILVRNLIDLHDIIKITPKFLWLTNINNTGAAFSLSLGNDLLNRIVFIFISFIAIFIIFILKNKSQKKIEHIIYAMILGGAIGNLIDRIIRGSVTDFIWCDFPDLIMQRWPVFNLADSFINIAIALLLIFTFFFNQTNLEDK